MVALEELIHRALESTKGAPQERLKALKKIMNYRIACDLTNGPDENAAYRAVRTAKNLECEIQHLADAMEASKPP